MSRFVCWIYRRIPKTLLRHHPKIDHHQQVNIFPKSNHSFLKIVIYALCVVPLFDSSWYIWVLCGTFGYFGFFWVLLGTLWYFWVLFGNYWYFWYFQALISTYGYLYVCTIWYFQVLVGTFLVLLGTFWYFLVFLGTFRYLYVLLGNFRYYQVLFKST